MLVDFRIKCPKTWHMACEVMAETGRSFFYFFLVFLTEVGDKIFIQEVSFLYLEERNVFISEDTKILRRI
jgi:hypothetical protein